MECECGSTDISEDPQIGLFVCCDCGLNQGPIYDHSDGHFSHSNVSDKEFITRCGAPVNSLCPDARSALIIGTGMSQRHRWGAMNYADRRIIELKKILDKTAGNDFTQSIRDKAIVLTKTARAEEPHRKNMDIPFLAASCYICCKNEGNARTILNCQEVFGLKTTEERSRFNNAKEIVEQINNRDQGHRLVRMDDSGINIATTICRNLDFPEWAKSTVIKVTKKFNEKNILTTALVKNRIGVIAYFIAKNSDDESLEEVTVSDIANSVGSVSEPTIEKYYKQISHDESLRNGIIKYMEQKKKKYNVPI